MNGEILFSPTVPPAAPFNNAELNAFGSQYAATYGHQMNQLTARQIEYLIYDAAPQGYFDDLKILRMNGMEKKNSDEFFYEEKTFGRDSVQATANVAAGATQVVPVTAASVTHATVNMILTYPSNAKGTVTNVNVPALTITVQAMSGQTLPAVVANDIFAELSTVQGDGGNSISTYMRINLIERYNFIQLFARATRFGKVEMYKLMNAGTTDYIPKNYQEMLNQYRIDLSNAYWNGERGQVILADGSVAKTMGGVVPTMLAAGSPQISTTVANIKAGLEAAVLATQFDSLEQSPQKFLYATPRLIDAVQQAYKTSLTRYTPEMMVANMTLDSIKMVGQTVVLVPVQRFQEPSCFPASWANQMLLIDQPSIKACEMWGESTGATLDRYDGNQQLNMYKDSWVDGQLSLRFNNPLASAICTVS